MLLADSWVLIFLLLIPLILFLYFFRSRSNNLSLSLTSLDKGSSYSSIIDLIGYHLPFALRLLCIALIIVMLARPQQGQSFKVNKKYGIDMMFAVDTSQSMSALDLSLGGTQPVDRLTVLKVILEDFVKQRNNDKMGLLVFGEKAFTQCPLTTDHGAIIDLIDNIQIGMVGNSTAIGSAIAIGVKRLKDLDTKTKILILMTDGQNTAGNITPQKAAEFAEEFGIKIYTIAIGQDGEVPFQVNTLLGPQIVQQQIEIDEETLIEIANKTGGRYYRAKSTEDLKKIYKNIDGLEKSEIEVQQYDTYQDLYEYFLWACFALLILELILANTLFYRLN